MKTRILQKGKSFKIQIFVRGLFGWKWKNLYRNYHCGDGSTHRQLALFDSAEKAEEAIEEYEEEKVAEEIGWQIIKKEGDKT